MKINNKELQRLYKAYIRQKVPSTRKNCPSIKKIMDFFSGKTSKKQKTKIVDHITSCNFCAQEFEFFLQTLRYKLKINREIDDFLLSNKAISENREKSNSVVSGLRKRQNTFFPKFSWKYSSLLLGGAVITIIFIILFFKTNLIQIPAKIQQRSEIAPQIKLIEPIGKNYSKTPLSFKWSELKDSDYYIIELFNETLTLVWKSDKIYKNHYFLPRTLTKKLVKNKVYFWLVTALLPNRKKVESPLEEFTLSD